MDLMHGTLLFMELLTCSPGRFFAVHEVKMMLAFLLLRYDLRTVNGQRPKDLEFEARIIPDINCKLLVRKRKKEYPRDPISTK